ncbi:MAG: class I SAM-dependent methyltransferase [Saprospiraceae bacterium]
MDTPKDNFSEGSAQYKAFRPVYPKELYDAILSRVSTSQRCWDCGTGNGQVAVALAPFFEEIQATDLSQSQLDQAPNLPNVHYRSEQAEKATFPDHYFDLICVAQAAHWFHLELFEKVVSRVSKPGGLLAIWGYSLPRTGSPVDRLIDQYYKEVLGPFWDNERRHIDQKYEHIRFSFQEETVVSDFYINVQWSLEDLKGYLGTWSALRHYIKTTGLNPLPDLLLELQATWGPDAIRSFSFPLFLKLWRIE